MNEVKGAYDVLILGQGAAAHAAALYGARYQMKVGGSQGLPGDITGTL